MINVHSSDVLNLAFYISIHNYSDYIQVHILSCLIIDSTPLITNKYYRVITTTTVMNNCYHCYYGAHDSEFVLSLL